MADEDSILYYYRRLIAIRKEEPAVAEGSIEFIETSDPQILAYRRILGEDEILAIHNFGSEEKAVPPACKEGAYSLLLGNYKSDAEGVPDKLKAYESVILKKKQD